MIAPLGRDVLPAGIRSRFVDGVNGLRVHVLEAGDPAQPAVLLLHGFPELAFSWRKVMPTLAAAGYHVIAPDLRGYGRTSGTEVLFDDDLTPYRMLTLVRDALGLLAALDHTHVVGVVGHDFGSSVAAWCTLVRPDVFRSVTMMSAPFAGAPGLAATDNHDIHRALAALERPRKHYQWYYSTREANADMVECPQGVHAFLRAYYHHKSADWVGNRPFRLTGWTADQLAQMPTYYIMDLDQTMAQTVAREMPSAEAIGSCSWLPDDELCVYSGEYSRSGFQGGLQWYRSRTQAVGHADLQAFAGCTINVPSLFIAGAQDWGIYQTPGAIERMQTTVCTSMRGCHLLDGAGHWVQQEKPVGVLSLLLPFLGS